jgi:hypothetical protein
MPEAGAGAAGYSPLNLVVVDSVGLEVVVEGKTIQQQQSLEPLTQAVGVAAQEPEI